MKTIQCSIKRITQNGNTVVFEMEQALKPFLKPGQYMMASGDGDILPVPVFPCGMDGQTFTSQPDTRPAWKPGDLLTVRYPLGNGFSLAVRIDRLLMVCGTSNPLRLLPSAGTVLARGGEAALYSINLPDGIPPEIELLARDQLGDAVTWADGIIGDSALPNLPVWKSLITNDSLLTIKNPVQVLVDTPMLCGGTTDCGICAVKTRRGWRRACTDGPVFMLDGLEE